MLRVASVHPEELSQARRRRLVFSVHGDRSGAAFLDRTPSTLLECPRAEVSSSRHLTLPHIKNVPLDSAHSSVMSKLFSATSSFGWRHRADHSPRLGARSKISLRLRRRNIKTFQFALDEVVNCPARRPDLSSISWRPRSVSRPTHASISSG
jgi:hypothetical protein